MTQQPSSPWIKTTCAYCGVGCGVEAQPKRDGSLQVRGDKNHPANLGKLCSKGAALGETVVETGRLLHPMVNKQQSSWSAALSTVADTFSQTIAEHGPDSVAFYLSGQLLTEDYYVANKLMKGFIGSGNVDTNSRLCMSSSVAGHKRAFGSDNVPACYQDLEIAEVIILVGSNLAWCHPVLFQRIKAIREQHPERKLVVIDPRATATSHEAELHLAIKPGTDVLLFNGLLSYLANEDGLNQDYIDNHTQGFEQTLSMAKQEAADLNQLAQQLGISQQKLLQFYQLFNSSERVTTVYSQGVNQSSQGTDKVNSIINCHLASGKIGQPGASPFSITGQPNAMGGREVGGLANTLASHLEFANSDHQQLVSEFWQTETLAATAGLKAVDMFSAIASGKIKAIWIMATNPAVSLPDSDKVVAALKSCPFVVVSDCMADTDTTRLADVLLPAQGWAEKSGTVTNSERRISRQRRVTSSPGVAKPDWWIISEVAKKMGFKQAFSFNHEADIFREYSALTTQANQLKSENSGAHNNGLDLSGLVGISDQEYSNMLPQQWPVRQLQTQIKHQRLFADGRFLTASGKAQCIAVKYIPSPQQASHQYPLTLNSGRSRDQWHTMTRTGLSARLSAHQAEPLLHLHPDDAKSANVSDNQIVKISSQSASLQIRVFLDANVALGQAFAPIHWNTTNSSSGKVSQITTAHCDPISGQPETKQTPIKVSSITLNSHGMMICRQPLSKEQTSEFDYWIKQTIAGGYKYLVASESPASELQAVLQAIQQQMQDTIRTDPSAEIPTEMSLISFEHSKRKYRGAALNNGHFELAYIVDEQQKILTNSWLELLLTQDITPLQLSSYSQSLMSAKPQGALANGKIICACKQVGENQLKRAIADDNICSVKKLSQCTQAGTGCGSCIPELAELLAQQRIPITTD